MDDLFLGGITGEDVGGMAFHGEVSGLIVEGNVRRGAGAARLDGSADAGRGAFLGVIQVKSASSVIWSAALRQMTFSKMEWLWPTETSRCPPYLDPDGLPGGGGDGGGSFVKMIASRIFLPILLRHASLVLVIARTFHDRVIAPSLLAADFSKVGEETSRAINAGADWLHLDVMDGHFVDNISFGPAMVQTIHESNDIFLDVHLMISRPDHYLPRFIAAGSDLITVHVEAEHDVAETLTRIREAGCLAGLALNPATPFEQAIPFLNQIDLLLCMTVVPGFGGQPFMESVMPKVAAAAAYRREKGLAYHIEVDGGIGVATAAISYAAGANVMVAGSTTFGTKDMATAIAAIREA